MIMAAASLDEDKCTILPLLQPESIHLSSFVRRMDYFDIRGT